MVQIYGIDLASEKFDVSYLDKNGKNVHKVVKNAQPQIEAFLDKLPEEAWLVAENTGVYGDLLLCLANARSIRISYVSGYEIKHSSGLTKGKSDKTDAAMIRDYGERHLDKLELSDFPSDTMYKLKELHATRRMLVGQRKQLVTMQQVNMKRPVRCDKASAVKDKMVEQLSESIKEIEDEMQRLIASDEELHRSSLIAQSVPGIGLSHLPS